MIEELDSVVLVVDMPQYGLQAGDVGTVVLVHGDGLGYEVEFATMDGEALAVVTLSATDVRPVQHREIAHVRLVA